MSFDASWLRPGGGHSFSGPSSSSGSHSGGGGGGGDCFVVAELVVWLVQLTFDAPAIGVPLDLIIIGVLVYAYMQKVKPKKDWSSGIDALVPEPPPRPRAWQVRSTLANRITSSDPEFSLVLFEDFVYALYAAVQEHRGGGRLAEIGAYLKPAARATLVEARSVDRVEEIVVGALHYEIGEVDVGGASRVVLSIEANYTEHAGGTTQRFYVDERWTLRRRAGVLSRPPERARIIGCPKCGAPLRDQKDGVCSFCHQHVGDPGAFDWAVDSIVVVSREAKAPSLTGTVEERGTGRPTVVSPNATRRLQEIGQRDAAFSYDRFLARVGLIFNQFQVSWSARDLAAMRPFLSDGLFDAQQAWVRMYLREGLTNKTDGARITHVDLANVVRDAHYDAITVRIFASGLDYTVRDADGAIVGGSNRRARDYTEYWTFIRGTGATTNNKDPRTCPNCGAPLEINMAGSCKYCQAKVTSGEFDWVLSRIEQDEVYG